ncbi:MAG: magnesium transporter CorA family protein [Candidatus Poseidoniales archaeon]
MCVVLASVMVDIRFYDISSSSKESGVESLDQVHGALEGEGIAWLDILQPDEKVKEFLVGLDIDELIIEDIFGHADTTALKFSNHRYIVVNARDADNRLDTEPLAIIMLNNVLVTLRHSPIPAINVFRKRVEEIHDDDLQLGVDFLLYELLDAVADDWTPILGRYSRDLDELEFQVFDPSKKYDDLLEGLHDLKRKLRQANKSIESLNTVTMRMIKPGERFVAYNCQQYFNDLHQLSISLLKRCTNYSAGATSSRDTYLSNISMQLSQSNAQLTEVMTTLTIIGAIMLPLTLIAGIFGMNNEDLPTEPIGGFWGIMMFMGLFALVMLIYFWRKGWIGSPKR